MSKDKELSEYTVKRGLKLKCVICGGGKFWTRETLMNTKGMSFLNLDWANKSATNYICGDCGYVHWFMES